MWIPGLRFHRSKTHRDKGWLLGDPPDPLQAPSGKRFCPTSGVWPPGLRWDPRPYVL